MHGGVPRLDITMFDLDIYSLCPGSNFFIIFIAFPDIFIDYIQVLISLVLDIECVKPMCQGRLPGTNCQGVVATLVQTPQSVVFAGPPTNLPDIFGLDAAKLTVEPRLAPQNANKKMLQEV